MVSKRVIQFFKEMDSSSVAAYAPENVISISTNVNKEKDDDDHSNNPDAAILPHSS